MLLGETSAEIVLDACTNEFTLFDQSLNFVIGGLGLDGFQVRRTDNTLLRVVVQLDQCEVGVRWVDVVADGDLDIHKLEVARYRGFRNLGHTALHGNWRNRVADGTNEGESGLQHTDRIPEALDDA